MPISHMLIAVASALVLSLCLNWLVRRVAHNYGWVTGPRSARHIHRSAVPRLGGIGVFASFLVVTSVSAVLRPGWLDKFGFLDLLIPSTVMFAVGLWDDFRPVPAKVKLLVQIVCGSALSLWMHHTPVGQTVLRFEFGSAILLIGTIFWVVLVSNSINLIDGVDGLAGGTAALSLAAVFCVALRAGQTEIAFVAIVLVGSILGFLRFNFNPATIFLGDGGSLFLGFMLSGLGMAWGDSRALGSTVAVSVAILALPLAETGVSVIRRLLSGRPLFAPDREHMHHKLLDRGFSQRGVMSVLHGVAGICGLAGIAIALGGNVEILLSAGILSLVFLIGVTTLGYVEFREIGRIAKRITEQRQVIANNVVIRKIAARISRDRCLVEVADDLQSALLIAGFDGFELVQADTGIISDCVPRSSITRWGCSVESPSDNSSCWSMAFDLTDSTGEKLGWVRIARKMDRGNLLFDANVLVSELQPALVCAIERCVKGECAGRRHGLTTDSSLMEEVHAIPSAYTPEAQRSSSSKRKKRFRPMNTIRPN